MLELSPRLFRIAKLPPEDMRAELLELAAQQQKLEHRLKVGRKATQKWRAKHHGDVHGDKPCDHHGDVTVMVPIEEKEEHSFNIGKKVSNRRVSKKRCQIPADLACSDRNVADAIKVGVPNDVILFEWSKFHDHHLHKGNLGSDWNAGWRRWCQNYISYNKLSAKPERRKTIHDIADDLRAAAATIPSNRPETGCELVGGPVEIISTDYRYVAGTNESLGGDLLSVPGKRSQGDLLPDDRDGYQF